jgi:aspartate aminotransferase
MGISKRLARVAPSATLAAGEKARRLREQGVDIVDLGPGQPDFPTPPEICRAGQEAIDQGHTRYTPGAGVPELRAAVANYYTDLYDIQYEAQNVIIANGGKHALYSVFASILDPGDEVIIPTPYWVSYPDQVRLNDGEPVYVDAAEEDGFVIPADAVAAACTDRTRAIILNSPSNPTGAVIPQSVLEDFARLAIERDLVIVYDECYDRFVYEGQRHASPLDLGTDAKPVTIVVGSASKTYSMTGWRIGWAVGPREIIDASSKLNSHLTSNACSVSQQAALAALSGDQASVAEMLEAFEERRELVIQRLAQMPNVTCARPMGAFYAFPNISALLSDQFPTSGDLANHLIDEAHVVTVPGTAFGRDGYLRLSFAVAMDRLEEAMDRLDKAFEELE